LDIKNPLKTDKGQKKIGKDDAGLKPAPAQPRIITEKANAV
jgi:hypothetical protein